MRVPALALLASTVALTPGGGIGPLHVDRSTRANVIAFMGKPQVEVPRMFGYFQKADPLDALGYRCAAGNVQFGYLLRKGAPPCLTVFWVDRRTGKLGNVYTAERRFADAHGIHVGTSSATVESALHKRLVAGCTESMVEGEITFVFDGGRVVPNAHGNHVVGAHVVGIVVDGHQNTGLFECW